MPVMYFIPLLYPAWPTVRGCLASGLNLSEVY